MKINIWKITTVLFFITTLFFMLCVAILPSPSECGENIKEVVIEKECQKDKDWASLKKVDEEIIILKSEALLLAAQMVSDLSSNNIGNIESLTIQVEDINHELQLKGELREDILNNLDY